MDKIIVSACLLGCECRYDGKSKPCDKVLALAKDNVLIPVCPEQLGGLTTPRVPSERQRDESGNLIPLSKEKAVIMKDGKDVTQNYYKGALMALDIAKINNASYAILKAGSPSCGKSLIYDGSFSGAKKEGNGVTTEIFQKEGIKVISEDEL